MPFAVTWAALEIVMLSEVSQTKTSILWYHLYVESKKTMNLIQDRNRLSDKLTVTKGEGRGQGINWECGINRYDR